MIPDRWPDIQRLYILYAVFFGEDGERRFSSARFGAKPISRKSCFIFGCTLVQYIDCLVRPTSLVARDREDLLDRLAPALCAFPHADLEADEFFLPLGRRAEQHQHTVAMLFHAGLQVNAVGAGIHVVNHSARGPRGAARYSRH
jgi:hypothetical protein